MCSEFCSPVQTRISILNLAVFSVKNQKKEHARKIEGQTHLQNSYKNKEVRYSP